MRAKFVFALAFLLATAAALPLQMQAEAKPASQKSRAEKQTLKLSKAALGTAVADKSGKAVGVKAYPAPIDAVKAGDMAAYLQMIEALPASEKEENPIYSAFLALDRTAAGDFAGARTILETADSGSGESSFYAYLDSWLLALENKPADAIERHRSISADMPGLTGDLSLAALLEALGRNEEALAVYAAMTPTQIKTPEHDFDPEVLIYTHVQQVVWRHALLLQRMGRIEEAKTVYKKLADAQPEESVAYAAALESLETGKYLDNKVPTVRSAFVRSLSDVSNALQEQRMIRTLMLGGEIENFDAQRSAFDQIALLIDPDFEDLRSEIVSDLYRNAYYDGVAHVARSAPKPTAGLQIAAAQALIKNKQTAEAKKSIDQALRISEGDDRLGTLYGALQLRTMLEDKAGAYTLVKEVQALSGNKAEQAAAYGLAAETYGQFGDNDAALQYAEKARSLDDTHDRRMVLVDAMGKAGQTEKALELLRSELLTRPNDPYTMNTFGYFLITRTDKYEDGFKLLFRARSAAPRDPYIADSLGWAYFQLGDLKSARRLIEESQREILPQHNWEIENHLGDIYWHAGEKDAARAAWSIALENAPPLPEKHKLEDKLAKGLTTPPPAVRPIPKISLDEEGVNKQEI